MEYKKLGLAVLLAAFQIPAWSATTSTVGFYAGGSLGYSSIFNLCFGINHKEKAYLDVSPGIYSFPENTRKNYFTLARKFGSYLLGTGIIHETGSGKNVANPGLLLGYDWFDFGIKIRFEIIGAIPITSAQAQDVVSLRVKSLLFDW